jgi:hypothetical protein
MSAADATRYSETLATCAALIVLKLGVMHVMTVRSRIGLLYANMNVMKWSEDNDSTIEGILFAVFRPMLAAYHPRLPGMKKPQLEHYLGVVNNCVENEPFFFALAVAFSGGLSQVFRGAPAPFSGYCTHRPAKLGIYLAGGADRFPQSQISAHVFKGGFQRMYYAKIAHTGTYWRASSSWAQGTEGASSAGGAVSSSYTHRCAGYAHNLLDSTAIPAYI